jgi:hypothetical protein
VKAELLRPNPRCADSPRLVDYPNSGRPFDVTNPSPLSRALKQQFFSNIIAAQLERGKATWRRRRVRLRHRRPERGAGGVDHGLIEGKCLMDMEGAGEC